MRVFVSFADAVSRATCAGLIGCARSHVTFGGRPSLRDTRSYSYRGVCATNRPRTRDAHRGLGVGGGWRFRAPSERRRGASVSPNDNPSRVLRQVRARPTKAVRRTVIIPRPPHTTPGRYSRDSVRVLWPTCVSRRRSSRPRHDSRVRPTACRMCLFFSAFNRPSEQLPQLVAPNEKYFGKKKKDVVI